MPIQLHNKQGATLYHRTPDSKPYSIFGENGTMDYGYEPISNSERNKKGLFEQKIRESSYYSSNNLYRTKSTRNSAPVWVLPEVQHVKVNQDSKRGKTFEWPYSGKHVILTGDFDNWKGTVEMKPVNNVFLAHVNSLDFSKNIHYKFIVDGKWCINKDEDTATDDDGNVNNVIYANK